MKTLKSKYTSSPFIDINYTFTKKGVYIGVDVAENSQRYINGLSDNIKSLGLVGDAVIPKYSPHVTIIYSEITDLSLVDTASLFSELSTVLTSYDLTLKPVMLKQLGKHDEYLVVQVESELLSKLRKVCEAHGIVPTYTEYTPHISLFKDVDAQYFQEDNLKSILEQFKEYPGSLELAMEIDVNDVDTDKVFLGGTIRNEWREQLIPSLGIDYYNPKQENADSWTIEDIRKEEQEKEGCKYLLYVITPEQSGFYSIAEMVASGAKRKEDTFCVLLGKESEYEPHVWKSLLAVFLILQNMGVAINKVDTIDDLKLYLTQIF